MRTPGLGSHWLLALVPAVVVVSSPTTDRLRATPTAGLSIRRTLETKGVRTLTAMEFKVGDKQRGMEDIELESRLTSKYVILDKYLEVDAGRVNKLERTFESLAKVNTETRKLPSDKDASKSIPETCDLAGETVVFTWNAEKKAYVAELADGDRGAASLTGLNLDMDYQALLPPPNTPEGARWNVDMQAVKTALLRPAGNLPFQPAEKPQPMDRRLRDAAWNATKGHLVLTCKTERDVEGVKVAPIAFEGTLTIDASVVRAGEKDAPDKLSTRSLEKIQGELLWDIARGGPHSIEWSSTGKVKVNILGKQPTQDGAAIDMEQIMSFDQEYTFKGSFKVL